MKDEIEKWYPYIGETARKKTTSAQPKKRTYPERDLVHLPLMQMCRNHPILGKDKFFLMHVENERQTTDVWKGAMRRAMGVKSGCSDLLLLYPSGGYHGLALELKAPGKRPTPVQTAFLDAIRAVGFFATWSDDPNSAYNILISYLDGNPHGRL